MHSKDIPSIFLDTVRLLKGISRDLREPSTINHRLAIPLDPKVLKLIQWTTILSALTFGFCYPWLIPVRQVDLHAWK